MSKKFNVTDINTAIVGNIARRVEGIEAKAEYNLMQIPLNQINLNEKNNFGIRDIQELAESMKKYGQLHNAVVRVIYGEEQKYEMISGERRYRAALELGWTSLACKIVEADDIEAEMLLIVANLDTRELNDMERSDNARRLYELLTEKRKNGEDFGGKKTRELVAEKMKIAPATVQKLVGLKNLIPELQELVKDKGVGLELSNQWAQMPQDLQKLVYQSMQEGMTFTAKTAKELKDNTKNSENEAEYQKAIEDMKIKLQQKEDELKTKDNQIKEKDKTIEEKDSKIKSTEDELAITKAESKEEIEKLKESEKKVQKELNTYKERWEASKKDLSNMREKLKDKEKEMVDNKDKIRKEIEEEIKNNGDENNPKVKELQEELQKITQEHENFKTESENEINMIKNQVQEYEVKIKESNQVKINAKVIQGNMEIMSLSKQAKQLLNTLVTKLVECKTDENFELKDETKKAIEEILKFGESLK